MQTPLYNWHKEHGARMVDFAGWEMPVSYTGIIEEHQAVREKVGLFDISHMGEIFVEGVGARDFINFITSNDITRIQDGRCQYAVCCYEDGGIVDDVISYQFSPEKYLVVVNASNTEKDYQWFLSHNPGLKITNRSAEYCQLALQGPRALETLQALVDSSLRDLKAFNFQETAIAGKDVLLSRTGYTGEDGFEIYGPWEDALILWESLMQAGDVYGIQPIGLAARDTLRLESCYSLYGHEISQDINPFEAKLDWVVRLDKKDFIGKKNLQLKMANLSRRLVGLESKAIPRQGYGVFFQGKKVGEVTSGTYSPTLKKAIGLALVGAPFSEIGGQLELEVRGKFHPAKIVSTPFYKRV